MNIGDLIHGFRLTAVEPIPELDMQAYRFDHEKSGADLLWLSCDDENRAFSIAFKTLPEDSTGIFHILEHSVLCGSEKFPLREPFVDLIKGSLSTFLNAMTFPDKTMYPIASTNEKDYLNLIDVYMDAVLHTRIGSRDEIFMQEGWHYEPANGSKPAAFSGVVYNEMKGSLSSPDSVFMELIQNAMYPDTPYAVNSGGDPRVIPSLTYEAFIAAHEKYYVPENSYICLYGSISIDEVLGFLDEKYLSAYEKRGIHFSIPRQEPLGDRTLTETYELGTDEPLEGNAMLGRSVMLCDYSDRKTLLGMKLLLSALTSSNAAPLKRAVLDEGLGDEFDAFVNDYLYQSSVVFYLKKTDADKRERFLSVLETTLRDLANRGIDRDLLMAAINKTDFNLRERDSGTAPGVEYAISVMDTWLYGGEPTDAIKNRAILDEIREGIDAGYFEDLIRRYLLSSEHALTLVLVPSHTKAAERLAQEAEAVRAYEARIGEAGIAAWSEKLERLHRFQTTEDTPEVRAMLPHLDRADLTRAYRGVPVTETTLDGVRHRFYDLPTSGISYLRAYYDISGIPIEDMPYVSLLAKMLFNVSTETHTLFAFQNDVDQNLGGLTADLTGYETESGAYHPVLLVYARFLEEKYPDAQRLLSDGILHVCFRPEEVAELVKQQKAYYESSLVQAGDTYAYTHAGSYVSTGLLYEEAWDGIRFGTFLTELCRDLDGKLAALCDKLSSLAEKLFVRENAVISFVGSSKAQTAYMRSPYACYTQMEAPAPVIASLPHPSRDGIRIPSSVAYDAMVMDLGAAGLSYHGAFQVLSRILTFDYLWNAVRVRGGAYGVRALFINFRLADIMRCTSYRDPHVGGTYQTFSGIPAYLRTFSADESEMTKYVIGAVSSLDTPYRPSANAYRCDMRAFAGMTDEKMQAWREETIDTTAEQIRSFAEPLERAIQSAVICTVGAADKLAANEKLFDSIS